jgi:hypothetical protein
VLPHVEHVYVQHHPVIRISDVEPIEPIAIVF